MRDILLKYSGMPFRYGADCCTFVAECIRFHTGKDLMQGFDYSNQTGAMRIIARHGSLSALITSILGEPYAGVNEFDVCVVPDNNGAEAAGIVYNDRIIARVPNGLMDYPTDRGLCFWVA